MTPQPLKEGPHGLLIDVMPGHGAADCTAIVRQFSRDRGIAFVLAFSGGADDRTPILDAFRDSLEKDDRIPHDVRSGLGSRAAAAAQEHIAKIVRSILEPLRDYRIAVLTGGTRWGVPDAATKVAKSLGFATIGVFPAKAKGKSALGHDLLDLSICVHPFVGESKWGDESGVYTKLLNAVVVIGGGAGTMVEVAHLLKLNEESSAASKWIIPVHGTGGTADKLSYFPGKPETMVRCVPQLPITSGREVVEFLHKENILTEDVYEPQGSRETEGELA